MCISIQRVCVDESVVLLHPKYRRPLKACLHSHHLDHNNNFCQIFIIFFFRASSLVSPSLRCSGCGALCALCREVQQEGALKDTKCSFYCFPARPSFTGLQPDLSTPSPAALFINERSYAIYTVPLQPVYFTSLFSPIICQEDDILYLFHGPLLYPCKYKLF